MWGVVFVFFIFFFFLMVRRPPRSTQSRSSAASDVYKRQVQEVTQKALEMTEVKAIVIIRGDKVGMGGQIKVTLI